jgi:hypothetical protein
MQLPPERANEPEPALSISLRIITCLAFAFWLLLKILRDVVGFDPAPKFPNILSHLSLMMMGVGLFGLSLLYFHRGKGSLYLGVTAVALALVLLSGWLFLRSLGVGS